jgi:hypothetical protein
MLSSGAGARARPTDEGHGPTRAAPARCEAAGQARVEASGPARPPSATETYAAREARAPRLEAFRGGNVARNAGTGVLLAVLLVLTFLLV